MIFPHVVQINHRTFMYPNLIFQDQHFPGEWVAERASWVETGLRESGLVAGDTAAFMLANSPLCVSVVLGCRLADVYLVAVNWHFKASEVSHILSDSGARVLFVSECLLAQALPGIPSGVRVVVVETEKSFVVGEGGPQSDWGKTADRIDATQSRERKLSESFVPYTSGTTGRPKGVRKLPYSPEQRAQRERDALSVKRIYYGDFPEPVALLSAPVYHTAPMGFMSHFCTIGATLLLEPRFDAERTLALIEKHRVTHVYLVPTMFQRLLKLPEQTRRKYDVSSLRRVTSTGSPCAVDVKLAMIEWFGPVITEAYASSEAGTITFIEAGDWMTHRGSVGRPAAKAEVRIFNDQREPVPVGEVGMIYVKQHSQADFTYINNPSARADIEHQGLICLGDMGYLDQEGYLYVCDRKADMVISGGANIYPAEIEAVLQQMPGVRDCAVFGVPDEEFGESLMTAVQPIEGANLSESSVRTYLRDRIAGFKVPRSVVFFDQLPREDTGKIFKRLLREPYWQGRSRKV